MDIAEIRKKAKVVAKPSEPAPEPAAPQALLTPELEVDPASGGLDFAALVEPDTIALQKAEDGLDRLFAAIDEFSLRAEEPDSDQLVARGESHVQAGRQYLAFHLGAEEYALDISQINEIIKTREFTDIPRSPEFVLGIISLRGVVVPVFDLRLRLNLGASQLMPTSRIVVCLVDEMTVGLLVDSINQVFDLVDDEVEPPPGVLSGLEREMVAGIGRHQGRMIILLNLGKVLHVELH